MELFKQRDAMNLMWYQCKKCEKREKVWNSRPRVTPFSIGCPDCQDLMLHVDWHLDIYAPNHIPKKGDRIFIDWSEEAAEKHYNQFVIEHWDDDEYPMSKNYNTPKEALKSLMNDWGFGEPATITLTKDVNF